MCISIICKFVFVSILQYYTYSLVLFLQKVSIVAQVVGTVVVVCTKILIMRPRRKGRSSVRASGRRCTGGRPYWERVDYELP